MPVSRRFISNAQAFAAVSLALLPMLAVMRVYEYFAVRAAHELPPGAAGLMLHGLRVDAALVLWLAAILVAPILILGAWRPGVARTVHRAVLTMVVLAGVALVQYFAVTFVPLGADLFAYSLEDIRETTSASTSTGALVLVPLVIAGCLTWFLTGRALRAKTPSSAVIALFVAVVASLVVPQAFRAAPAAYANDASYFLADNTSVYFWTRTFKQSARAAWARRLGAGSSLAGFPLLHPAAERDVLGAFFKTGAEKPNIVVVIVEGLGRDFVGPDAKYGGFTPFLDSLAAQCLNWENFISTTGRTFGVLPAMLGSLPPMQGGFMELGTRMPRHVTLASLLKERGYTTSFFTGTDGHFDMIDVFMERQGVDSFIDDSRFGAAYVKQPASGGGVSWGYGDQVLFQRSLTSRTGNSNQPRLDIYLTITTHEPFIPPRAAEYGRRFQRQLALLRPDVRARPELARYSNVFETLLYLDDALRELVREYAKRADYGRTIFVITGDHRLIPIPPGTRIDRYRVPFIIHSPMLKGPRRFASVSSHLDVTPSWRA